MATILCFVPESFADFEIVLALHLLNSEPAWDVKTAGYSHGCVTAQSGLTHTADYTLEEAAALTDIDAFLLPGGPLRAPNDRLSSFLQTLQSRNVLLGAICFAPQYLAHSGLLDARRFTTSCTPGDAKKHGMPDPFPRENFAAERVVKDGNIITAQGHAFVDFAFAIAKHLGLYDKDEAKYTGFYRKITDR